MSSCIFDCTIILRFSREVFMKKQHEPTMKVGWRINPAHKLLQTRMDHMRRFRHQHEQLQTVIIRVLRPNFAASRTANHDQSNSVDNESKQVDSLPLDSTDTSAIEVSFKSLFESKINLNVKFRHSALKSNQNRCKTSLLHS